MAFSGSKPEHCIVAEQLGGRQKSSGVGGRKEAIDFCQCIIRQLSIYKAFGIKNARAEEPQKRHIKSQADQRRSTASH